MSRASAELSVAGTPPERRGGALSIGGRLQRDIAALYLAALALLPLELLLVARYSALGAGDIAAYTGLSLVVFGWLSLVFGATAAALGTLGHELVARVRNPTLRGAAAAGASGLLVGMFAVAIIRPWDLHSDPAHFAYSVPTATVLGALALWLALARLRGVAVLAVAGAACAAVFVINALWYRGLYVSLHRAALWLAWTLLAFVLGAACERAGVPRRLRAGLLVAWLLAHAGLGAFQAAHELSVIHGSALPAASSVVRAIADRDHDGYAGSLGGGDCDDGDPAVHPGQCEQPGNRRDDNCNGLVDPSFAASVAPPGTLRTPLPDIYFVVIDTLRADFGGPGRARGSPTLEAFAARSLDFTRAYTPYPATLRAMSSMIQSRSPRTFDGALPDLASLLVERGYDAQLWIGETRLAIGRRSARWPPTRAANPFSIEKQPGQAQFSQRIRDEAMAELAQGSPAPRFRWLHLLDLHPPLLHAPDHDSPRARYLAELAHVESLIAPLFAAFDAHARTREALIVVMGDHGEQFGEHGATFHDAFVWEESIKVPLLMRLPATPPRRITAPASLLDVAPTVLRALGIPQPQSFEGHDWLSRPERRASPPIAEVSQSGLGRWGPPERQAAIGDRYKLTLNVSDNLYELYDLQRDPGESTRLRRERVPESAQLLRHLHRYQDQPGCRR